MATAWKAFFIMPPLRKSISHEWRLTHHDFPCVMQAFFSGQLKGIFHDECELPWKG